MQQQDDHHGDVLEQTQARHYKDLGFGELMAVKDDACKNIDTLMCQTVNLWALSITIVVFVSAGHAISNYFKLGQESCSATMATDYFWYGLVVLYFPTVMQSNISFW